MSYEFADGYKIREQSAPHFLTFTICGWLDIFSRKCYRDLILENMQYCRKNKGVEIGAYVMMTNHIHTIWRAKNDNLSDVIRDFKSYTSKKLIEMIGNEHESRRDWLLYMFEYFGKGSNRNLKYKVWADGSHPEVIYTGDFLLSKLHYLHQNPVRAGLVALQEEWLYSSALDYAGKKGLMEIDLLY